ncbi:hypothetical protein [Ochrobactrum quorumnocens]|uniref:hypothetical protein n=1 Tax=Ochrobactrum quorumnocens TaxID=271865 RepID=UPI00178213E3|nr:hypothetical protein [[Ochrobactrum] quorumnocens]
MNVSFNSDWLRDVSCNITTATEEYGPHVAQALVTLIADAEAAENASEWHEILGTDVIISKDCFEIEFGSAYNARFVDAVQSKQLNEDGSVKWLHVSRLKLMSIMRRS